MGRSSVGIVETNEDVEMIMVEKGRREDVECSRWLELSLMRCEFSLHHFVCVAMMVEKRIHHTGLKLYIIYIQEYR